MSPPETLFVLLVWGTLVGVDLVTMPQVMVARPLVAGTVAGLVVGEPLTGLAVGVLFELLQFDVLPVGASRYPEYGPATVAAVAAAQGAGEPAGLALGALVGLATALIGGLSLGLVRRLNTAAVRAAAAHLEGGDPRAIARVHRGGVARDAARALIVTAVGLLLAAVGRVSVLPILMTRTGALVAAVVAGVAVAAATSGTFRLVGRGRDLRWLLAGMALGAGILWLR